MIVQRETQDTFCARIENVGAGQSVTIKLHIVSSLHEVENITPPPGSATAPATRFWWRLPRSFVPRYAPAGAPRATETSFVAAATAPYTFAARIEILSSTAIRSVVPPPGASFSMDVDAPAPVPGASFSMDVDAPAPTYRAVVDYPPAPYAGSDFVLSYTSAGAPEPRVIMQDMSLPDAPNARALQLTFLPSFPPDTPLNVEFQLVLDCSGSMFWGRGGTRPAIAYARSTLDNILDGLKPGSTFNITYFGTQYTTEFTRAPAHRGDLPAPEPVAVNSTTIRQAHAGVQGVYEMGCTEMLAALESIYARAPTEGFARHIIILTDGAVSNTAAVHALVRAHAHTARVFAYGIGDGASPALVKGMAEAGHGAYRFIYDASELSACVLSMMKKSYTPSITEVELTWPAGRHVTMAPRALPPIFADEPFVAYAALDGEAADGDSATLAGRLPDGSRVEWTVRLPSASASASAPRGGGIAALTARALIKEKECDYDIAVAGGPARGNPVAAAIRASITALSLTVGVESRFTSWVATTTRATVEDGVDATQCVIPLPSVVIGTRVVGDDARADPLRIRGTMSQLRGMSQCPAAPAAGGRVLRGMSQCPAVPLLVLPPASAAAAAAADAAQLMQRSLRAVSQDLLADYSPITGTPWTADALARSLGVDRSYLRAWATTTNALDDPVHYSVWIVWNACALLKMGGYITRVMRSRINLWSITELDGDLNMSRLITGLVTRFIQAHPRLSA